MYNSTLQLTQEYAQSVMMMNDVAHDYNHVERVLNLATKIAKNHPDCNMFILKMVALLHDIEDSKLLSSTGNKVSEFLKKTDVDESTKAIILESISYISFRNHQHVDSSIRIEARIVQDADRIDAIGAVGIARTFAYSGANNIPFYDKSGSLSTTLSHFREKLLVLTHSLNTVEGKEIARQRQEYLNGFYYMFLAEITNTDF